MKKCNHCNEREEKEKREREYEIFKFKEEFTEFLLKYGRGKIEWHLCIFKLSLGGITEIVNIRTSDKCKEAVKSMDKFYKEAKKLENKDWDADRPIPGWDDY